MKSKKTLKIALLALVTIAGIGLAMSFKLLRTDKVEAPEGNPQTTQKKVVREDDVEEEVKLDITNADSLHVLVNKTNPINPLDYAPTDLVLPNVPTVSSDSREERSVRKVIEPDLIDLFSAAEAAGHDLIMNSGYRSSAKQAFYYNNYVRQSGEAAANRFSAKPGYSEHQTGLSLDINYTNRKCYLEECFGDSSAGKWLAENVHMYGFILRYPKGKEGVTGYQYEPWHFRYVGKDLAKKIYEENSDYTYEEYLAKLKLITLQKFNFWI